MSLITLCLRRSIALQLVAASAEAGLAWQSPLSNSQLFTQSVTTAQPRFALITQEYLSDASLFNQIRLTSPQTLIIICITQTTTTPESLWPLIDALDFDALCTLPELAKCLQQFANGQFYKSSLLQLNGNSGATSTFPGLFDLTQAGRKVLFGICQNKTGPQLADVLFVSTKTINNHKYKIAQKLQISGGPGCLTRFVLDHRDQLKKLLA